MRGLAALVTLALPGLAFCAETTWVTSATTPEAFARRTDMAMKNASGLSAKTMAKAEVSDQKLQKTVAVHNGLLFIKSPTVFHIEYPRCSEEAFYKDWMTYKEVANGKKFARERKGGWKDQGAVAGRSPLGGTVVMASWPLMGPARVLGSIGTNHAPITALIREARAAKATFKVERSSGTSVSLERLKISRKGDGKNIKPFEIEIITEPNRGLPLSMFSIAFDSRKKSVAMRWAAKWDTTPQQNFQSHFFTFDK